MADKENNNALFALSPLDGRYREEAKPLAEYFCEAALIRRRVFVELEWLKTVRPLLAPQTAATVADAQIDALGKTVDAPAIKKIEREIRHDLQAVVVWLARKMQKTPALAPLHPLLHFGCTSWDINNIAQTQMAKSAAEEVMLPLLEELADALDKKAKKYAEIPMLARTHGQPASPTTVGKEFANFAVRLDSRAQKIAAAARELPAKMNGATGNYNAHCAAFPAADWPEISRKFVESESIGLRFASHTTQIEPYDGAADLFNALRGANTVLLDFSRDIWGYIALEYFNQSAAAAETGSSAMPHKVNPIDFENAEGNLGLANAVLSHLSEKLPVSRWQRDLSDSTVMRSVGSAFAHSLIAWRAVLRGLQKITPNEPRIAEDLNDNWQVLAEAAVAIMRAEGIADAYETIKKAVRGKTTDKTKIRAQMRAIFQALPLSKSAKQKLLSLTPKTYLGQSPPLSKTARKKKQ